MNETAGRGEGSDIIGIARTIATRAHADQTDKSGAPYIQHPTAVVSLLAHAPGFAELTHDKQEVAIAMAWLHDVLEDTPLTSNDLRKQGLPPDVIEGVIALTHMPQEPRLTYYARLKENPLARLVKIADMAHNASPERLLLLEPDTRTRLINKYSLGAAILTNSSHESLWFSDITGVVPYVDVRETR